MTKDQLKEMSALHERLQKLIQSIEPVSIREERVNYALSLAVTMVETAIDCARNSNNTL